MTIRMSWAGTVTVLAMLPLLAGCGSPETPNPVVTPTPIPATQPPKDAVPPVNPPVNQPNAVNPIDPKAPPRTDGGDAKAPIDPRVAAAAAAGTKPVSISGHTFALPAQWKVIPPSNAMRKFQAVITKSAGDADDGDFSVSIAGGGVDSNVSRWASQFGGADSLVAKREIKTAGGLTATVAELQGPYTAMTMQGQQPPKDGYAQLGAIIVTPEGDYFLKFVGPKKTVDDNKAVFDAMVGSFK